MLPSPYGVSFILILLWFEGIKKQVQRLPSPYGVSFILIWLFQKLW